ncbi:hypothetical protein WAI453_000112 [Rhynchosporium graminicola]
MAEAVGLAASIAGLIWNTGQIAKTGLFIKGFLSAIKDAPNYIRSLAAELESLSAAAAKTGGTPTKCKSLDMNVDFEGERKIWQLLWTFGKNCATRLSRMRRTLASAREGGRNESEVQCGRRKQRSC